MKRYHTYFHTLSLHVRDMWSQTYINDRDIEEKLPRSSDMCVLVVYIGVSVYIYDIYVRYVVCLAIDGIYLPQLFYTLFCENLSLYL